VGSCALSYTDSDSGFYVNSGGVVGLLTWTSEHTATYSSTGLTQSVSSSSCGTPASEFICPDGAGCLGGSRLIQPTTSGMSVDLTNGKAYIELPQTVATLSDPTAFRAYSVAACYCPSYDNTNAYTTSICATLSEFVQQVGMLYFYATFLCRAGDPNCGTTYTGVTPQYQFKIRVMCPTGACSTGNNNRVKIVPATWTDPSNTGEVPSWDTAHMCRAGLNREEWHVLRFLLLLIIYLYTSFYLFYRYTL
jgi:hypothetical protein